MRMFTLRAALALAAIAFAAVVNAQCANTGYGNGVTCITSAGVGGLNINQTSQSMNFSPVAGRQIIVGAYQCWDRNCLTTGTSTLKIATDKTQPNAEPCFTASPHSPFTLIETGAQHLQMYMWYCPSIPSGVTAFYVVCSPAASCNYITFWVSEWTGLTPTSGAGAFDTDGGAASTGKSTTASVSTNPGAAFTKDLFVCALDNTNDLTMTVQPPFATVNQFYAGNILAAMTSATGGVKTCTTTWTGADDWYGTIMAVKTAASTATLPAPTNLRVVP